MLFQINTRLYPRSATKSRVPSELTATGFNSRAAVVSGFVPGETGGAKATLNPVCPKTTSADVLFCVGMVFQINTRWFWVSATNNLPFCIQTPCGPRKELALIGWEL